MIVKIFKALWFLILWPLEIIVDVWSLFCQSKAIELSLNPKILIVKIDQLGDVLFSTQLLRALKQQWPNSQIDYLINPKSAAILASNPHINSVYYWSSWLLENIPGRKKTQKNQGQMTKAATKKILLDNRYDLVINGRAFWPSSNFFARQFGGQLIAFDISQFSGLADVVVPYDLKIWEEDNYRRLLVAAGVSESTLASFEARGEFYNFSSHVDVVPRDYWVLAPVSFDPERTWSIDKWSDFVKDFLQKNPTVDLIASGTRDQLVFLESIKSGLGSLGGRFYLAVDLSIAQLAGIIRGSSGFIGLDSFSVHLAVALSKKAYCLVNSDLFYVPGLSQKKLVDGRSILPRLDNLNILDLNTTKADFWR